MCIAENLMGVAYRLQTLQVLVSAPDPTLSQGRSEDQREYGVYFEYLAEPDLRTKLLRSLIPRPLPTASWRVGSGHESAFDRMEVGLHPTIL